MLDWRFLAVSVNSPSPPCHQAFLLPAPLQPLHYQLNRFARAENRASETFYLLDHQFIRKSYEFRNRAMEGRTGQGIGRDVGLPRLYKAARPRMNLQLLTPPPALPGVRQAELKNPSPSNHSTGSPGNHLLGCFPKVNTSFP